MQISYPHEKAIIIGAGIAGPAMALHLKKIGIPSLILEARDEGVQDEGLFIGITPNGLNALAEVITTEVLNSEFTSGKMVFCNAKGKSIATLDTAGQRRKYGAETIQVRRSALNDELRSGAVKNGVRIAYGYRLAELREEAHRVIARFENGETYAADFIIACDGAFSVSRRLLFPDGPRPRYTGQLSTGAIVPGAQSGIQSGQITMIFGREAFFAYALSNKGDVWWFNNFHREPEPSREEVRTTLQDEVKSHLLKIHANDAPVIAEVIRRTGGIFAYPIYDIGALEKWHTNRICLIGDAAHATAPHIGQGASLALEDAAVLARCISKHQTCPEAFAAFQQMRKPRVDRLVSTARKVGNQKTAPNRLATFFRDVLLKYFIRFEIRKMDWVYGYKADSG